jgi:6-pyruvoyltetrahydropterin/6-carboxytetrahydropterin synthase
MYTVRTREGFAAAHFLRDYHGKCEKLHGHNYVVAVTARGERLGEGGMLVDFEVLKTALRKITSELDHTNLNDHPEFGDGSPSAERIAKHIFDGMKTRLPGVKISLVEVFETETNCASYSEE